MVMKNKEKSPIVRHRGYGMRLSDHQKLDIMQAFNKIYESIKPMLDGSRPYHEGTIQLKKLFDNIKDYDIIFLKKVGQYEERK